MSRRAFWKISSGVAGLLVLLAALIAANFILSGMRMRADLTREKLYTLSDGTKGILKKLEQPVTLKLFFSGSAPEVPVYLKNYAKQVQDLLGEYRQAGGRRVVVETYDPTPDSDAEEWAQRYGLTGQSLGVFGPPVYFGLVAVVGDTEGSLPSLDPRADTLLEYNITRLIYRVSHPRKPVVGVISSLPVLGLSMPGFSMPGQRPEAQPAWTAFQDLREDYTVRDLTSSAESIDPEINTVILVHPKELPEKAEYALDQFVLRGGHLMAFVDPLSVADMESSAQQPFMRPQSSSNLEKLFKAWGVTYDPGKVVADMRAITRVGGPNNRVEESPVFLSLGTNALNRQDVMTAQLESLLLPFAGAFACESTKDVTVTPLIRSSTMAAKADAMAAQFGAAAIRRDFKPEPVPLNLAVRLTGKFQTAFPEGAPKDEPAKDDAAAKKDEDKKAGDGLKEGSGTVILVADCDLLMDRFCVEEMNFLGFKAHRPRNDNLSFFANAVEQLSGSSDLIGIRSRGTVERPFTRVDALEEQARQAWQSREEELVNKLQEARQQLSQLENTKDSNQRFILSGEQKAAIARFKAEEVRINGELKQVRKSLRSDIEQLGAKVKFANIALVPLLVIVTGVGFYAHRKRRR